MTRVDRVVDILFLLRTTVVLLFPTLLVGEIYGIFLFFYIYGGADMVEIVR